MPDKVFLRNVVGEYMETLGEKDPNVLVVNADLSGTCRNTSFVEIFPNRSFNVGIAEQNMVSFAAGLAHEGFKPYVFSMAPFLSMRACEQVRTDVAYGNKNVKMISVYAGVSGGISGATHWSIEDCGIITSMPNIAVFEISDGEQAKQILDFSLSFIGPMYIRCGVEPVDILYNKTLSIKVGGSITVVDGDDGAILCSGVIVQYAINAAKSIKEKTGKSIRVVDMYSIKPVDIKTINDACLTGIVLVAQDHNVFGGLGTSVAKVIAEGNFSVKFKILGIPDEFTAMAHAPYLYKQFGIDSDGLQQAMIELLDK